MTGQNRYGMDENFYYRNFLYLVDTSNEKVSKSSFSVLKQCSTEPLELQKKLLLKPEMF